ncbi:hypothetical protein [Mesomycoplasma ovipneumoniae]|uniref:hypothetical protein n=1 Tax=Mesomycoplasma ovipneumoniae TaxID=29562 RepID=UPI0029652362|nr:hypothetical protein [Mesomycoplasma ovipneumoniae]MDW2861082.1 hypothetical protein [Mesomycoplasma ovipneumoniae]
MKDIVQIEINNLPDDVKKEYYKLLTDKLDDHEDWKSIDRSFLGDYDGNYDEDPWDFKDNHSIDELLEVGFRRYPNEFIDFQKKYKESIYNQTIQENDFKDLGYRDIVKDLTHQQKKEVIKEILNQDIYLTYDDYYRPTIEQTDKHFIHKLDKTYKNKWVLTHFPYLKENPIKKQYFKNDDDFIVFVMEDGRMGHEILNLGREEYLNPHNKVNQWVETKYELELAEKDISEQTQKFEAPKLKM